MGGKGCTGIVVTSQGCIPVNKYIQGQLDLSEELCY